MKPGVCVRFVVAMAMSSGASISVGDVATVADPDGCWEDDLTDGRLAVDLGSGGVYYVDLADVEAA